MSRATNTADRVSVVEAGVTGDGYDRYRVNGTLDTDGSPAFADALDELFASGVRRLALDMTGVDFITSCGIGTLVASVSEFRDEGGEIVLLDPSQVLVDVFDALCLLDYLIIRSST